MQTFVSEPSSSTALASVEEGALPALPRRRIVRELLLLQLKLGLDSVKDLVLVPISIGAAIVDLMLERPPRGHRLAAVMRAGEALESWLDLYSGRKRLGDSAPGGAEGADAFAERIERELVERARKGELGSALSQRLHRALDGAQSGPGGAGPKPGSRD